MKDYKICQFNSLNISLLSVQTKLIFMCYQNLNLLFLLNNENLFVNSDFHLCIDLQLRAMSLEKYAE